MTETDPSPIPSKPKRGCLKIIGVLLLLGLAIFALVPMALPSHCHIERSIDIAASPEAAFALVADQSRQRDWSPWIQMDPDMQTKLTGQGVGAVLEFDSKKAGQGSSVITEMEAPRLVKYHLEMIKPMQGHFEARMDIAPTAAGCHLTWSYDQDFSYPKRWFSLIMDKMVGGAYQKGVENIKKLLETKS